MSADSENFPTSSSAVAASRFDRNGVTAYNLALRLTGSPGAAWYATIAAFAAVTERVPADAAAGVDDQDLVLMSCWHARQLLAQVAGDPAYAEQLRAHDAATRAGQAPDPPVAGANAALGIDQRELLAMNGLSGLDHAALAGLLHADPGLLAVMVAEARLQLHDLLHGSDLATRVGDDRQPIALAALRQDGQLGGPEAQSTLEEWIAADPAHAEIVDGLEAAGQAYRAWPLDAAPAGLRDAAVAAAAAATPAPLLGNPPQAPVESMPAGEHDRPIEPPSAPDAREADPGATVEWSPSEVAALGLEGAPVRPAPRPSAPTAIEPEPIDEWDDDDRAIGPGAREPRERAPRWHIALVGVLLIAVIVVLILTFTSSDDPTTPVTPSNTTTRSAAPADGPAVAALAAVRVTVA
jgi:hypothetical protein